MTTTPRSPATAYSVRLRAMTNIEQTVMAITLTIRKRCVMPQGTGREDLLDRLLRNGSDWLTLPEISKIEQLVTPLGKDSECVLEEGDHDQKSAYGWEVARWAVSRNGCPFSGLDRHTV